MPRRPNRGRKQMLLVAQVLSTVLADHVCVKLLGHEEVAAPSPAWHELQLFLRPQSVPSVTQPHGTTSPDLSRQVCPCDLDSSFAPGYSGLVTPDAPPRA